MQTIIKKPNKTNAYVNIVVIYLRYLYGIFDETDFVFCVLYLGKSQHLI